eukprot:7378422-Prymnesium_polylepis.2
MGMSRAARAAEGRLPRPVALRRASRSNSEDACAESCVSASQSVAARRSRWLKLAPRRTWAASSSMWAWSELGRCWRVSNHPAAAAPCVCWSRASKFSASRSASKPRGTHEPRE